MAKSKEKYTRKEEIIMMEFSNFLREYRAKNDLPQTRMAAKLHVSLSFYNKLERREMCPSFIMFYKFCDYLEIRPVNVMEYIEERVVKKLKEEGLYKVKDEDEFIDYYISD